MSRTPLLLIAAVGVIALPACAPTPKTDAVSSSDSNRQCFAPNQINNVRGNNLAFYLRNEDEDVFEIKTLGYCPEIDFTLTMGFVQKLGRLCTGDTSHITMADGLTPRTVCQVQVVKKLTEAEIAALPSRDRPASKRGFRGNR